MFIPPSHHLGKEPSRSRYRLLGLVGQGQFGRVFCAVHRQTGELVALKNLERERFSTHKFLRELRFLLSLQHPNIVTCRALEHTPTGRCLVMDYCEAGTLRSLMDDEIRLALPQSLKLVTDILAGLEHAHSQGIIHCDIKPENILLNVQPYGWTAKISDFGIARLIQELPELPTDRGNTGSPAYMAPERFYGQYSQASDIYSVGVLLFELLAGHRPFSGTPLELMSAHLNQAVRLPETIPAIWQPIIVQALQKLAARRFHSAAAMLAAIDQVMAIASPLSGAELPISKQPLLSQPILSQPILRQPLLQPIANFPLSPFQANVQQSLAEPCTSLTALVPEALKPTLKPFPGAVEVYVASRNHVMWQRYLTTASEVPVVEASVAEVEPARRQPTVTLPCKINELLMRPQGCFAIANRAVYLLTPTANGTSGFYKQPVATSQANSVAAIEAQGRWLATATLTADKQPGVLTFFSLPNAESVGWLSPQPLELTHLQSPHSTLGWQPQRLIALDARQVVLVSSAVESALGRDATRLSQPHTSLEVFTRRGDRLIRLTLPLLLGQIVETAIPYRLMATDKNDPYALVMIDLMPLRITRLGLDLIPHVLASTCWGYVVADAQGQLLLLDEQGQRVGRVDCPAPVTAIAPFHTHGILVTTQLGDRSTLYILDLKQLSIDLMF